MRQITIALSSRNMDALPSSTEALTSISGVKNVETCQVIKLRNGKEYEGFAPRNKESSEELPSQDNSKDEVESFKEPSSEGHNE